MVNTNVTPSTYDVRLVWLRFFFEATCQRPEMKQCLHYRTEPRKLPFVFSIEEVFELLKVAPGPGLKYRAALSISYGTGPRASEVCNLKVTDIDSNRMLIHVEKSKGGKDRKVMLSPGLLELLRNYRFEARLEGWLFLESPGSTRSLRVNCTGHSAQPSILPGSKKTAKYAAHTAAKLRHPTS